MTFTSSRLSNVRTLDHRTSWALRRNNTKASPPRSLRCPPHHPYGRGWHHLQQLQAGALKGAGYDSQRVHKLHFHPVILSTPSMHFIVLLSTLIRSRIQVKPVTLSIPIDFLFSSGEVLCYPIPKRTLFLDYVGSGFGTLVRRTRVPFCLGFGQGLDFCTKRELRVRARVWINSLPV